MAWNWLTLSDTVKNFLKAVLASASAIFEFDLVTCRDKTGHDAAVLTGFKGAKDFSLVDLERRLIFIYGV